MSNVTVIEDVYVAAKNKPSFFIWTGLQAMQQRGQLITVCLQCTNKICARGSHKWL